MALEQPWDTEPNDAQFAASGYPCSLRRGILGCWCGYCGVFEGHPWFGLETRAPVTPIHDELSKTYGALDLFLELTRTDRLDGQLILALAVHVHGGVTYAKPGTYGDTTLPQAAWYFGFDCGHPGDVAPRMPEDVAAVLRDLSPDAVYRDYDYATGEVLRMAAQLRLVERRGTR